MRFFFYGTLMDEDVRRAVLGVRALAPAERATLEGWRRVKMAGVSYPMIGRARNHKVDGILMHGIDRRAHELLQEYEGDEYTMIGVEVQTADSKISARMFVPRPGLTVRGRGPWDLVTWQRRHKRRFLGGMQMQGKPLAAALLDRR
jgi:Gamma-glutamyl cyclotransferase, AIG2-like